MVLLYGILPNHLYYDPTVHHLFADLRVNPDQKTSCGLGMIGRRQRDFPYCKEGAGLPPELEITRL